MCLIDKQMKDERIMICYKCQKYVEKSAEKCPLLWD